MLVLAIGRSPHVDAGGGGGCVAKHRLHFSSLAYAGTARLLRLILWGYQRSCGSLGLLLANLFVFDVLGYLYDNALIAKFATTTAIATSW